MGEAANRDEAFKCLQIAEASLAKGDLDKAQRFAEKAMKLLPSEEVVPDLLARASGEGFVTQKLANINKKEL